MLLERAIHPLFVHFPIAFFLLASGAGLAYLWWRREPLLRLLTWAAMLLGWLGGAAAALTGLVDQSGLPPDAPYRSVLNWHISAGLGQLAVYGLLLYQRWLFGTEKGRRARARRGSQAADLLDEAAARPWISTLLALGAALVAVSGWNGGRLVYEWAVNVAR